MTEADLLRIREDTYQTCLRAELAKVTPRNRSAPHNHPTRIAARASDQTKACMAQLAEQNA